MSPFGRRNTAPRTPEERERDRLEREARRAEREGRPLPPPPEPEEPAWVDEPVQPVEPVAAEPEVPQAQQDDAAWDYGDPVSFDGPNGHVEEPVAPSVPDPSSRSTWDDTDAWDAAPAPAVEEHERLEPPAADEERPKWDDTGAWEPAQPDPPATDPAPTLGEEIAAVDRGWFEEESPAAPPAESAQETVEWDVLQNKPKEPVTPPADRPAGVDSPTVEFDVLSGAPKEPVTEAPTQASSEPPTTPTPAAPAPVFGDEHERPVPTRRVNRARSLPPTPPLPGEKRPRTRRGFGKGTFLLIVLALVVAAALYLVNALFQPLADDGTGEVQVNVPRNSSTSDVADLLEREGVVNSAFFFEIRTRLSGESLKAGKFTLQQGMPYGDAIDALTRTPEAPPTVKVAIPEGRARRETAPLVKKAGLRGSYLEATEKATGFNARKYGAPKGYDSLEGFLFPATYELKPNGTARQLVQQQLGVFERELAKVGTVKARISGRKPTTYELLKIASMIEREATLPKERRLVAAVIYNRLKDGMPLGIDATIRYATRNWSEPLKQSELRIDSPYNTRLRQGLPPTPIGSPGLASIKAAANPAKVDYLFYVVKPNGDGAHNFSSTDAEFQKDVDAYNREREKRGGKDPSSSDGK
jgi:UPF0755 protein